IAPDQSAILELLRRHGVFLEQVSAATTAPGERFAIDSVVHNERPFQGHRETRLVGHWRPDTLAIAAGSYVVRAGQPLGFLALYLLDPESDDGLVTWNFL